VRLSVLLAILAGCSIDASGLGERDAGRDVGTGTDSAMATDSSTATDSGTGTDSGAVTDGGSAPWWSPTFTRRRLLMFDNGTQDEDLDDFPVLVVLDGTRIDYGTARSAGEDIRFVDEDGATELAHEIEEWNESGVSVVWVKVPRIDRRSGVDAIFMYWGDDTAPDTQSPAEVWSNGYEGVWHMETPGNSAGGPGVVVNGSSRTRGVIGDGRSFDGVDDYLDTRYDTDLATFTVSAWTLGRDPPGTGISGPLLREENFQICWDHQTPTYRGGVSLRVSGSWPAAAYGALSTDTWYWLAGTYDGDTLRAYVDDRMTTENAALSGPPDSSPHTATIARHPYRTSPHPFFRGSVDEARIESVARSTAWMHAQYLSMTDAFIDFGPEERL
jgi:hypothetical protein